MKSLRKLKLRNEPRKQPMLWFDPFNVVLVGMIVVFLIVGLFVRGTKPSPEGRTRARIAQFYLRLIEEDPNGLTGFSYVTNIQGSGIDLPYAMFLLRDGRPPVTNIAPPAGDEMSLSPMMLDGWGRPLMFAWKTNFIKKGPQPFLEKNSEIIIWSKGPNGTNDWGYGDDIL